MPAAELQGIVDLSGTLLQKRRQVIATTTAINCLAQRRTSGGMSGGHGLVGPAFSWVLCPGLARVHCWLVTVKGAARAARFLKGAIHRSARFLAFRSIPFWRHRLRAVRRGHQANCARSFFRGTFRGHALMVRYACRMFHQKVLTCQKLWIGHHQCTVARRKAIARLWARLSPATTVGSARKYIAAYKEAMSDSLPAKAECVVAEYLYATRRAFKQSNPMDSYRLRLKDHHSQEVVHREQGLGMKMDAAGMLSLLAANSERFRHRAAGHAQADTRYAHTPGKKNGSGFEHTRRSCDYIYASLFKQHMTQGGMNEPPLPPTMLVFTGDQYRRGKGKLVSKGRGKRELSRKSHKLPRGGAGSPGGSAAMHHRRLPPSTPAGRPGSPSARESPTSPLSSSARSSPAVGSPIHSRKVAARLLISQVGAGGQIREFEMRA